MRLQRRFCTCQSENQAHQQQTGLGGVFLGGGHLGGGSWEGKSWEGAPGKGSPRRGGLGRGTPGRGTPGREHGRGMISMVWNLFLISSQGDHRQ